MQKNNKITKAMRVAMIFGAGTTVSISAPAFSAEEGEEKAASPIIAVSSSDILDMVLSDISADMTQMPFNSQGNWAASAGDSWANHLSTGFRGLGANRTLTAINGKRTAPYGLARY